MALDEARELGHPCMADEHVLLGVIGHGASRAATLLRACGLDLATARAELLQVAPTLGPAADPAGALRSIGVDVEQVRRRLEATFGPGRAGGVGTLGPTRCASTFWPSARSRSPLGSPMAEAIPVSGLTNCSTGCSGTPSTRWHPAQPAQPSRTGPFGFTVGRPNPVRLQLEARGIGLPQLAAQLGGSP
ncbi:MAG: Clp protease N-terminal domain-containing protein [Micromonosporaceae bacterium]